MFNQDYNQELTSLDLEVLAGGVAIDHTLTEGSEAEMETNQLEKLSQKPLESVSAGHPEVYSQSFIM
ncbi:MAG: hypothetical protein AB4426_05495 [Xenococcaceae cyanobacterium]